MKKLSLPILLLFSSCLVFSQDNKLILNLKEEGTKWYQGTIYLKDETGLTGLVQYNDKNGALSLRDGTQSESFSANTVSQFIYTDETSTLHTFISLESNDNILFESVSSPQTRPRPLFFEILKETKNFVLLSRVSNITYSEKQRGGTGVNNIPGPTWIDAKVKQWEVLIFVSSEGKLMPYVEFNRSETTRISESGEENTKVKKDQGRKRLDRELLQEITGDYYSRVMDYAKANKLNPYNKNDLLALIDHYKALAEK